MRWLSPWSLFTGDEEIAPPVRLRAEPPACRRTGQFSNGYGQISAPAPCAAAAERRREVTMCTRAVVTVATVAGAAVAVATVTEVTATVTTVIGAVVTTVAGAPVVAVARSSR